MRNSVKALLLFVTAATLSLVVVLPVRLAERQRGARVWSPDRAAVDPREGERPRRVLRSRLAGHGCGALGGG